MTVQALRTAVGDDTFFEILRTWTAEHKDSTATTDEFIALAEKISGVQLDDLLTCGPSRTPTANASRCSTPSQAHRRRPRWSCWLEWRVRRRP